MSGICIFNRNRPFDRCLKQILGVPMNHHFSLMRQFRVARTCLLSVLKSIILLVLSPVLPHPAPKQLRAGPAKKSRVLMISIPATVLQWMRKRLREAKMT
jgi:hypothetical protein